MITQTVIFKKRLIDIINHGFVRCAPQRLLTAEDFVDRLYDQYTVEGAWLGDDMLYFDLVDYFEKKVIPHKVAVFNEGINLYKDERIRGHLHINGRAFITNLFFHDLSKFSENEAMGYACYKFGQKEENSQQAKDAFERAWHHHKMNNPHHPEYWLNPNRSGELEILHMPDIYIAEMIADWAGAGKTYGASLEDWVPANFSKFRFHPSTESKIKYVLTILGINTH